MINNKYINKIIELNRTELDRIQFHKKASSIIFDMGNDKNFWFEVFKQNLTDQGYLNRTWTMYEIPFLYVYECDDFNVKIHLFSPLSNYEPEVVASAIHHHNNYILTSYAAFGSGYETMLFEKEFQTNPDTKETNLKIREHFTQQQRPIHMVDAWEPHVVVNPTSLSATLILWSPDKKRVTDSLRSNPVLKAMKFPLRRLIYLFGLDKKIGIAAKNTFQYYVKDNKFYAILEEDYFAPTKAQKGESVNNYSIQTVFAFIQRMGFNDIDFLNGLKLNPRVPKYYHKWIDHVVSKQEIPDTFAKEKINVPGGRMTVSDLIRANNNSNIL